MRLTRLWAMGLFLMGILCLASPALAQDNPDPVAETVIKKDDSAHWALRGFSEIAFGTLFGTVAGGGTLVTGLLIDPRHATPTFIAAALIYPAGVASGTILGGYLTDSKASYWEPFVGAYAGALVADVTAYFLSDEYPTLCAMMVILLPVVTSLAVTEVSHARRKPAKNDRIGTTVMPLSFGFNF